MKKNTNPNKPKNRSNPRQQMDKYMTLAKDAISTGDRVSAERYYQHADHFYRLTVEGRSIPKEMQPKGEISLAK